MQRVLLLLLLYLSYCTSYGQQNIKVNVEDFNKDGVMDTLTSFYEGGSGFGGKYVKLINGKTNETHQLNNDGCYCMIKGVVLIPPELHKQENKFFLEAIKNQLLPQQRNVPDSSLDWMIKGAFSNTILNNNAYFDLIVDPEINWQQRAIELPESYYVDVESDTLGKLYSSSYETPTWFNKTDAKGFLVYYAYNHSIDKSTEGLLLAAKNSLYEVFNTQHGIVVKKGGFHKWVFISDVSLTGAPGKLRWKSIKEVRLLGKYLIVRQDLPPDSAYRIFIINVESGICGRLKYYFSGSKGDIYEEADTFQMKDTSVIFNIEGEQTEYKLQSIFKELETQYLTKSDPN